MNGAGRLAGLLLCPLVFAVGCGSTQSLVPPTGGEQVRRDAAPTMHEALALWRDGRAAEAVERYVLAAELCEEESGLLAFGAMGEDDFGRLPQAERERLLASWLPVVSEMRGLSKAVLREGGRVAAAGGAAQGQRYVDAVLRVGRAHDRPGRVDLARHLGRAMVRAAEATHSEF